MFDEEDYYSDEEETLTYSVKHVPSTKVLAPSSGSDFNHLTGEGESLLKIMKDRGFDLTDYEMKKIKEAKQRDKSQAKVKSKAGFFDGGDKATLQQLMKALNKAFSKADPQQASCILSYILEKKGLSPEDRNKFSIMKCNILFGLGAYQDCLEKSVSFMENPYNKLSFAILSNIAAKCKVQTNRTLSGYMDLLRAKNLINEYKNAEKKIQDKPQSQVFIQSEVDTTIRQISHTELQYNIKMSKYKNQTNLIHPYFPEFRHRRILKVVCGDYHSLFLVGGSLSNSQKIEQNELWETQVFGLGEDTVGQISGKQTKVIHSQPVLISQLSGKGIRGIWANKQSSMAYDINGNIYEWGIKEKRNDKIEITYTVGEEIKHFEKGYKHYALLTESGKFYSWGKIQNKNVAFYNQPKPHKQDNEKIVRFSCGNSHTIAIDSEGISYALGNNDVGQLGISGERFTKLFKKINNCMIGEVGKIFCINDATFFINSDQEVFYCGKYSYKSIHPIMIEQPQQKISQAQFGGEFNDIITISGSIGNYSATTESGQLYRWEVDSMVKFKKDKSYQNLTQRYIAAHKGNIFRVKSMIQPKLCSIFRKTSQMCTYEPIVYELCLKDQYGLFGLPDFIEAPKCQIFLSTYKVEDDQLLKQNKFFMQNHKFEQENNKFLLNQIIEQRLLNFEIRKNTMNPWLYELEIVAETSGQYYFYVILSDHILLREQLNIEVSERQKQLEEKNRLEKQLKQEERRRKAELERQRREEQKMKQEMEEEERRKQTQRRAQQALKKHMREQQQAKLKQEQQRKAKKQLLTGGGFDLNKLKKKESKQSQKLQTFLPDINHRPSSKKKLNLPKPSQLIGLQKQEKTLINPIEDKLKDKQLSKASQSQTLTAKTKIVAKRGLSRKK